MSHRRNGKGLTEVAQNFKTTRRMTSHEFHRCN
jgi:hypothetical protein